LDVVPLEAPATAVAGQPTRSDTEEAPQKDEETEAN
jgi:hypothetical protein